MALTTSTALQQAIDCLQIHDVYLKSAAAELGEDFEPRYDPDVDRLRIELKHLVTQTAILELDGEQSAQMFRVYIELGARWVEAASDPEHGDGGQASKPSEPTEKARVEAVLVAEYLMREHPGEEALKTFAMLNASYHVWPYWREFLTSQCIRMNLPKFVLPAVQLAANRNQAK